MSRDREGNGTRFRFLGLSVGWWHGSCAAGLIRVRTAAMTAPARPSDDEFDAAFALLAGHFDPSEADARFPRRANAVYTASVVLWMLVYQRTHPDKSLDAAVKHLLATRPALLPDRKRVRVGTLSSNTSSYSDARHWLPLEAAEWFAGHVSQSLLADTPPAGGGRRVFLLDGTTLPLAPEPDLRAAYPPARNQHGRGVWPIALLVVAHELASGVAVVPQVGAKFGPAAVSETALAAAVMGRLPADSVVMADAGFGIFAVAFAARERGLGFVFRLTAQRAAAYRRTARTVASGEGWWTGERVWRPSAKERRAHPDWPADAELVVRMHEVRLPAGGVLAVVTDQSGSAAEVGEWYRQRGMVEVDLRNLKVVLDAEHMAARSEAVFRKELLLSVVAYNLVGQFRRQAAARAGCAPRGLSFKRVWTTFRTFLLGAMFATAGEWRAGYERAMGYAVRDRLPNRPPDRRYPREAYPRRPKADQFQKRKPRPPADEPPT